MNDNLAPVGQQNLRGFLYNNEMREQNKSDFKL